MPPLRITRAGLAGTVLAFLVAAVCVRLGIWQLHRLTERRAYNSGVAARMHAPALELARVPADTAGLAYRAVTASGRYDEAHSVVFAARSFQEEPGVWLLTPLRLADGSAILVNRGWLFSPDAATIQGRFPPPQGTVEVRGLLLPLPEHAREEAAAADTFRRVWYRPTAAALARQSPYPIAPLYLQELPAPGAAARPTRLPPPALGEGPHLSYAIQWFSFAAIALIGWGTLAARGRE